MSAQSVDPRTGEAFGPVFRDTSVAQLDRVLTDAAASADDWGDLPAAGRALALFAVADALDASATELVGLSDR